jgi:hypothetical protein
MLIFARDFAGVAQLVEHDLAKVGVAGSSPVSRSNKRLYLTASFYLLALTIRLIVNIQSHCPLMITFQNTSPVSHPHTT